MTGKATAGPPYEMLANAIIVQACSDYRAAYRTLRSIEGRSSGHRAKRQVIRDEKDRLTAEEMLEDVEAFFRSGWFMDLTEMNGEYLLRRLNEEVNSYE